MNYLRFINSISARRPLYPLRVLPEVLARAPPDSVFMGNGMPNAKTFPFTEVSVRLRDGTSLHLEGSKLEDAMQYLPTPGYPALIPQLKALQTRVHKLDSKFWESRDLLVTAGTLDAICKTIEMCLLESDPVVYQEPSYPGVGAAFRAFNPRLIAAVQDKFGVCPSKLRAVLQNEGTPHQIRSKSKGVPKLLYLNPTGSNPTGTTLSTERRKEIYNIACEYDLLILEDDPYYFITFEKENPVSFLSLDTEGRVIRFDSFSKVLSSGIRLGFMTSPKPLSERIELHMQVSVIHASALPQVLVETLLNEWKTERVDQHFQFIQEFYKAQRDHMLEAAEKHLKGLAEWRVPEAGMFLWLKILGVDDARDLVQESVAKGVILVSGHHFMIDTEKSCPYIRASFATASPQQMDRGFSRLAVVIKRRVQQAQKCNPS